MVHSPDEELPMRIVELPMRIAELPMRIAELSMGIAEMLMRIVELKYWMSKTKRHQVNLPSLCEQAEP